MHWQEDYEEKWVIVNYHAEIRQRDKYDCLEFTNLTIKISRRNSRDRSTAHSTQHVEQAESKERVRKKQEIKEKCIFI